MFNRNLLVCYLLVWRINFPFLNSLLKFFFLPLSLLSLSPLFSLSNSRCNHSGCIQIGRNAQGEWCVMWCQLFRTFNNCPGSVIYVYAAIENLDAGKPSDYGANNCCVESFLEIRLDIREETFSTRILIFPCLLHCIFHFPGLLWLLYLPSLWPLPHCLFAWQGYSTWLLCPCFSLMYTFLSSHKLIPRSPFLPLNPLHSEGTWACWCTCLLCIKSSLTMFVFWAGCVQYDEQGCCGDCICGQSEVFFHRLFWIPSSQFISTFIPPPFSISLSAVINSIILMYRMLLHVLSVRSSRILIFSVFFLPYAILAFFF